jgi:hypothetical protein
MQEAVVARCDLNVHDFPFDTQTCVQTYQSEFYPWYEMQFYASTDFSKNKLEECIGKLIITH